MVSQKTETNNPKNPWAEITDHAVSLDMAKEISMIQRSEKGKQARQYFIDCERKWKEAKPMLSGTAPVQSLQIDGVPVELPSGVPFSVTRSKTGVLTVRIKEVKPPVPKEPKEPKVPAKTPAKPAAPPEPPAPLLVSEPVPPNNFSQRFLSHSRLARADVYTVSLIGIHGKTAQKILTLVKKVEGHWVRIDKLFENKKVIPVEFGMNDLHLVLNTLMVQKLIICDGEQVRTRTNYEIFNDKPIQ